MSTTDHGATWLSQDAYDRLQAELDELILAMLSSEPIARPASAAAVIERLEAVAELPRAPEIETARGYVHSAALVGRKREMSVARSRLQRATTARGGALVIEGNSMRRAIVGNDLRVVDGDVGRALLEVSNRIAARLHHSTDQLVRLIDRCVRIVDEACLCLLPLRGKSTALLG